MAVPWLRLIDAALGVTDVVRRVRGRQADGDRQAALSPGALGGIEARLAGVVVAALKEAFARDSERMDLERAHLEAERERAEKAQRLELLRQAGDRELSRLRLLTAVALGSWLATLLVAVRVLSDGAGRAALGAGWLCLLLALAGTLHEHTRIGRALAAADDRTPPDQVTRPGGWGVAAPWLLVAGLASSAVGLLLS